MRVNPWLIDQSSDQEPTVPLVRCRFPASLTPPTYRTGGTALTHLVRTPTVPRASIVSIITLGVPCRTICRAPRHHSCLQVHHFSAIDECIIVCRSIVCEQCRFVIFWYCVCCIVSLSFVLPAKRAIGCTFINKDYSCMYVCMYVCMCIKVHLILQFLMCILRCMCQILSWERIYCHCVSLDCCMWRNKRWFSDEDCDV